MTSFDSSSTTGGYFGRSTPHPRGKISHRSYRRQTKTKAGPKPSSEWPVDTLDETITHRLISQKGLRREEKRFLRTMGPKSPDGAVALLRTFRPDIIQHYVNTGKRGFKGIFQTKNPPKDIVLHEWPQSTFLNPGFLTNLKPGIGQKDLETQTPRIRRQSHSEIPDTPASPMAPPNHKTRRKHKDPEMLVGFNALPNPIHKPNVTAL